MGSIKKGFNKIVKISTGGLVDVSNNFDQEDVVPAPELGTVANADITGITEQESEKQQLAKGKKRGKKSLKVNLGITSSGRNIV